MVGFVWFLLRYFSDLSSIELVWSKVKFVLRRLKVRFFGVLQFVLVKGV